MPDLSEARLPLHIYLIRINMCAYRIYHMSEDLILTMQPQFGQKRPGLWQKNVEIATPKFTWYFWSVTVCENKKGIIWLRQILSSSNCHFFHHVFQIVSYLIKEFNQCWIRYLWKFDLISDLWNCDVVTGDNILLVRIEVVRAKSDWWKCSYLCTEKVNGILRHYC